MSATNLIDVLSRRLRRQNDVAVESDRRVPLTEAPKFETLFDPSFLAALDSFALRIAAAQKGGRLAEQRTTARGQGTDFADFKSYVPGDDLRAIDWNSYRRLGKLFVRVFEERQDLPVYLLVDRSRSMFVERPPRILCALRTALAIAAVSLRQQDNVTLLPFSNQISVDLRCVTGRSGTIRVAHALSALTPGGTTALASAIAQANTMRVRRGLMVIVSDFFEDAGISAVTDVLRQTPHRLLLVQMVKQHDADPRINNALQGDVVLDDGEHAGGTAVSMTPDWIDGYRKSYRAFNRHLLDFASGSQVGLIQIDADQDVLPQLDTVFADRRLMM